MIAVYALSGKIGENEKAEKTIKNYYEQMTKDDLIIKARIAGVGHSNITKDVIIDRLTKYMSGEKVIEEIWNGLSAFEKEYMEVYLKYHESPSYEVLGALQKKHGIESGYFRNTQLDHSKINLFFMKNTIPSQIERELKKRIAPVIIKYDVKDNIPMIQGYLTILKRKAHAFSHWDESIGFGFEKYLIKV